MKIAYKPYRGKIEPVTKVHKSNIELTDNYIEVVTFYDYEAVDSDATIKRDTFYKTVQFSKRNTITGVTIDYYTHQDDTSNEQCPRIVVDCGSTAIHIWLDEESVFNIYKTIKDWILNEDSTSRLD